MTLLLKRVYTRILSFGVTGTSGTCFRLQRLVFTRQFPLTRRSMDPGQVWSFLAVRVGRGHGFVEIGTAGNRYFKWWLESAVTMPKYVKLHDISGWWLFADVRRFPVKGTIYSEVGLTEISPTCKAKYTSPLLQEFQCCFPGGTVLVLRKNHDPSESTGAQQSVSLEFGSLLEPGSPFSNQTWQWEMPKSQTH